MIRLLEPAKDEKTVVAARESSVDVYSLDESDDSLTI